MYEYTKSPVKNPLILGALSRPLIISHNAARETINAEKFPAPIRKNTDFSSLTPTMINESVKNLICQAEVKGASRTKEIDIFINFVGKVDIPQREVEPTGKKAALAEHERRSAAINSARSMV